MKRPTWAQHLTKQWTFWEGSGLFIGIYMLGDMPRHTSIGLAARSVLIAAITYPGAK